MIRPLGINILIRPLKEEEKTKSGLVLPEARDRNAPEQGEVLSVGAEVKYVKKGDKILFKKFAIEEVKLNDELLLMVEENDVWGVCD